MVSITISAYSEFPNFEKRCKSALANSLIFDLRCGISDKDAWSVIAPLVTQSLAQQLGGDADPQKQAPGKPVNPQDYSQFALDSAALYFFLPHHDQTTATKMMVPEGAYTVALPLSALTGILKPEIASGTAFIPTAEPHAALDEAGASCRGFHLFDFATNTCPVNNINPSFHRLSTDAHRQQSVRPATGRTIHFQPKKQTF